MSPGCGTRSSLRAPFSSTPVAQPVEAPEEIRRELVAQITSPVRWGESVQYMVAQGVHTFVEVGTGSVLRWLMRHIGV